MSKGSAPRPFAVSNEEYQSRWDAIFQKDVPLTLEQQVLKDTVDPYQKELDEKLIKGDSNGRT